MFETVSISSTALHPSSNTKDLLYFQTFTQKLWLNICNGGKASLVQLLHQEAQIKTSKKFVHKLPELNKVEVIWIFLIVRCWGVLNIFFLKKLSSIKCLLEISPSLPCSNDCIILTFYYISFVRKSNWTTFAVGSNWTNHTIHKNNTILFLWIEFFKNTQHMLFLRKWNNNWKFYSNQIIKNLQYYWSVE